MIAELLSLRAGRLNWLLVWIGLLSLGAKFAVLGTWFTYQALLVGRRPIFSAPAVRMNVAAYGIWAFPLAPQVLWNFVNVRKKCWPALAREIC
jgi:hypothetical protein